MSDLTLSVPLLLTLGALSIPALYALAAALPGPAGGDPFRRAGLAAGWGMLASVVLAVAWGLTSPGHGLVVRPLPDGLLDNALAVRLDAVTAAMLVLVSLVGFVIVRFSDAYLDGDPRRRRYARALLSTLAAVTLLVGADHLLVMALCWTGTSLSLHVLLTHFAERTGAQMAAHKKFIASRVADLSLLGALGLIGGQLGTLTLSGLAERAPALVPVPPALQLAAVLLVLCVALKSAQLPFHGWLTQVMEAPTPVSALLHAGVVNIGGFVLIRVAPLMAQVPVAQTLLVGIGTTTAVVAGLVMTTRTSVKGMLAWSTMAQMGFMLIQCGLGAYELALLHLVAHSFYKAHAFLSSGSAVERRLALAHARKPRIPLFDAFAGAALGGLGVAAVALNLGADPSAEPALWALALVLSLALTPLLVAGVRQRGLVHVGLAGVAVALVYFGWHELFGHLVASPHQAGDLWPRLVIVGIGFVGGFVVQSVLHARPDGSLAGALYPRLRAGLYLDELFTRLTFRAWPPRLAIGGAAHQLPRSQES